MRVVFLGTPHFAVPSLRALIRSHYVVDSVITQPDRPAGRGQRSQPPPVKVVALEASIPVHQPERIRSDENRGLLESLSPHFLVVVAYGQLLPGWLLKVPRLAPVNLHASLLPAYRGAAPIAHALLNGDSVTGVTTMVIEETLDTGPILLRETIRVSPTMTSGELEEELAVRGAGLVIRTLDGLGSGELKPVPQDHSRATSAPKITKSMSAISWADSASRIHNQVRAMNPWPVAWTSFRRKKLQVFRSLPRQTAHPSVSAPGSIQGATEKGILVQCGEQSTLELLEVQLEGRGRVNGREFSNGARLAAGETLG